MRVNVDYDRYNTKMVKATIPLEDDTLFSFELVEEEIGQDEENNPVIEEKLVLKSVDGLTDAEIALTMDKMEIREFVALLNKFRATMV